MGWKKLGRIFMAERQREWMTSHSSCPQAEYIGDDRFRIWFAPRDQQNRSYTGWLEIDITHPDRVLALSEKPASHPGGLGEFDECGAMFSCYFKKDGRQYIYYTGWNVSSTVPWRNAIGLTTAPSGGDDFTRPYSGPLLDRDPVNPLFVGNPWVLWHEGQWWMWYLRGTCWQIENGKPFPSYNIGAAQSSDGIHWQTVKSVSIDFIHPYEMAIARPTVRVRNGLFEMWYSFRGENFSYRPGYATSRDGVHWQRQDEIMNLPPSTEGWDSEMVAYPYVFEHKGKTYILYAGNGFSKDGIGLAVHEN